MLTLTLILTLFTLFVIFGELCLQFDLRERSQICLLVCWFVVSASVSAHHAINDIGRLQEYQPNQAGLLGSLGFHQAHDQYQ